MNQLKNNLSEARAAIRQGLVVAYPTEAVYGLGCNPFCIEAVQRIITLKQRKVEQGLIVLISSWDQLFPLIEPISEEQLKPVQATWPGPVTWIFPKSSRVPIEVSGQHAGIAIRMSAHPIAQALCQEGPLVSTSANIHGIEPARSPNEVNAQFPKGIDMIVAGELGDASQPSAIYDVLTGVRLR